MLEEKRVVNEFMIRMTDDGTAVKGCHAAYLDIIVETDTGEIKSAKPVPPVPASLADDGYIDFTKFFPDFEAQMVKALDNLKEENRQLKIKIQEMLAAPRKVNA